MGTRNLTAVKVDGEYKIAQYGQWDGYPSGQGLNVMDFLHHADLEFFKNQVRKCRFITDKEAEDIDKKFGHKFADDYPQLSRDMCAKILHFVLDNRKEEGFLLLNSIDFASDSLFCEWAYVIDFDANTFEVYKGFVEEPHTEKERFTDLEGDKWERKRTERYYPIKLLKKYNLDNIPTEKQFLEDCEEK